MKSTIVLAAVTLLASAFPALAQECKAYPYRGGIDPDQLAANRYVATASATVSFDDIDAVNDAREEATLEAKATLAQFLTEVIQSDATIFKIVSESKTMNGAGKENVRNEAIRRTKLLRNSSQALLRGVMTIGDCYTKGTEVRVTVGVKPESVSAAERLAGLGSSIANQPTMGSRNPPNASIGPGGGIGLGAAPQPLTNVEEYSNTKHLKKFEN
jgi:hypothetical protein